VQVLVSGLTPNECYVIAAAFYNANGTTVVPAAAFLFP
jgi:hypothetical protein